jgi:hypothetical protein
LKAWVGRKVKVNGYNFPEGRVLRTVAAELARMGIVDGNDQPFAPQDLKEKVYRALARSAVWLERNRLQGLDFEKAVGCVYREFLKWGRFKRTYARKNKSEDSLHPKDRARPWPNKRKPGVKFGIPDFEWPEV